MNKTLSIYAGVIALAGVLAFSVAQASSTATVTATVTVQNISLSVSPSSVSWGALAVSTASSTNPAYTMTVTNNGNVPEDFKAEGMDSTPAHWLLKSTNGANQYVQSICATSCTSAPTGYTALASTSLSTLTTNVAAAGTSPLDLYIQTPTSVSDYTQQTVNVTLTAVAH